MAARGRPKGPGKKIGRMMEEHRDKIRNSRLLTDLIAVSEGRLDISPTRLQAMKILIDKVMPSLAHIKSESEVSGNVKIVVNTGVPRHITASHVLDNVSGDDDDDMPLIEHDDTETNEAMEIDRLINDLED